MNICVDQRPNSFLLELGIVHLLQDPIPTIDILFNLGAQSLGLFGECALQGGEPDFTHDEILDRSVGLLGFQGERILSFIFQGRVLPVKGPVAGLDSQLAFFLALPHSSLDSLIDTWCIGDDQ